uniref:PA14 domain-containing protein n=1 Tax=Chromera velia CCMP2878 TaxID=1169474 RepID=A0A0G4HK36_9ALVE|eukprot:Cvel_7154.t1-p1 / transcript=Cvel_7154.t1 / gene=Cvel_7154 / organism=Chromera_velia_CCMP2878 / gene_product=hypothetical protein / transcript_product=hypothetical protein / location=Cvel_scaffold368:30477-32908(-) / protein_length=588 / sequence_SO=supercontig / SO=protein_coding / is_pseudo=false
MRVLFGVAFFGLAAANKAGLLAKAPGDGDIGGTTDTEQLKALTAYRTQHRRTITGQLCAAAFVQDGQIYTDCTTAAAPDGSSGREWCWLEAQLQGKGAQDWNYCTPVIDYDAVRRRTREAFIEKAEVVKKLIAKLNLESDRLESEKKIFERVCGKEHEAVGEQIRKIEELVTTASRSLNQITKLGVKIEKIKDETSAVEGQISAAKTTGAADAENCSNLSGYKDEAIATGLLAKYYDTASFEGTGVEKNDLNVNLDLNAQDPVEGVNHAQYSVRYDGFIKAPVSGLFHFDVETSGGARLFVGHKPVLHVNMPAGSEAEAEGEKPIKMSAPTETSAPTASGSFSMVSGKFYPFRLEAFHTNHLSFYDSDHAYFRLYWSSEDIEKTVIPPEYFYTTIPEGGSLGFIQESNNIRVARSLQEAQTDDGTKKVVSFDTAVAFAPLNSSISTAVDAGLSFDDERSFGWEHPVESSLLVTEPWNDLNMAAQDHSLFGIEMQRGNSFHMAVPSEGSFHVTALAGFPCSHGEDETRMMNLQVNGQPLLEDLQARCNKLYSIAGTVKATGDRPRLGFSSGGKEYSRTMLQALEASGPL